MRRTSYLFLILLVLNLVGCISEHQISQNEPTQIPDIFRPAPSSSPKSTKSTEDLTPQSQNEETGLSRDEIETLQSLVKVNDYPLYSMTFTADYGKITFSSPLLESQMVKSENVGIWACTLFTTFADDQNMLYGRNFDWHYSPSLLLFSEPPNGFASVSMVDLEYLYLPESDIIQLEKLPVSELLPLLATPWMPFDGMNDQGLVVGMAAVPPGNMASDPQKVTVDSLAIIRIILDNAKNVDEALDIFKEFNINYGSGPDLHYLISDRTGKALLVEFYMGEMRVIDNQQPWHLATNFLCSAKGDSLKGNCWRYDKVSKTLETQKGVLTFKQTMALLEEVSQQNTQWSIVYNMSSGKINVVMGRNYKTVNTFKLNMGRD